MIYHCVFPSTMGQSTLSFHLRKTNISRKNKYSIILVVEESEVTNFYDQLGYSFQKKKLFEKYHSCAYTKRESIILQLFRTNWLISIQKVVSIDNHCWKYSNGLKEALLLNLPSLRGPEKQSKPSLQHFVKKYLTCCCRSVNLIRLQLLLNTSLLRQVNLLLGKIALPIPN